LAYVLAPPKPTPSWANTMPLTDIQIRNAKPADTTIKLSDGGGLQLWIEPQRV
jgi:hypothetical protein